MCTKMHIVCTIYSICSVCVCVYKSLYFIQHMINKHMKLMNICIQIGFLHEYVTVKHEASAHGNTPYIIYHGDGASGEKKTETTFIWFVLV